MSRRIVAAALAAGLLCALPGAASPPQVHALRGARIVVEPGRVIETGTVVLRDGVIEAVGAEVAAPADARVWELEGLTVYAGLIEPYAPRLRPEGQSGGAAPAEGHPNLLVRADHRVTSYAAHPETARGLREAGFTTALVAPAAGVFRGSGALLNLGEGGLGDNLVRDGFGQFAAFERAAESYPRSLMGAIALFRQTLLDAGWYAAAHRAWDARPSQPRPPFDGSLAALVAARATGAPLVLETDDVLDTLRLARLAGELELDAWAVGNGEEYRWLEPIAAAGLPHLLPVAFPEPPAGPDEDDLTIALADLRHWQAAPDNPRRLLDAGLTVAFTSHGLAQPKSLHGNLARSLESGLDAERALAALTTTPAALLGIADRAGTVSPGKMANLVVVEGELFSEETRIREVWIDGRRYEIKETEPPEVEPAGTWQLTVETPDGEQMPVILVLVGEAPSLSGTIAARGRDPLPLAEAEVSGKTVEISFDSTAMGMPGTIRLTLEIEGERASGNGVAPQGPFTISGSRSERPEAGS